MKDFGRFSNPAHETMADLIMRNLASLNADDREQLARIVRRLRSRREDADYRPGAAIDEPMRRNTLRDMRTARVILGEAL